MPQDDADLDGQQSPLRPGELVDQAFLTDVTLMEIAGTTLDNLDQVERGEPSSNDLLR